MPVRVQLKRTAGWRMPPNCRSVARPGPFGNPFTVAGARDAGYGTHNPDGTRATAAESEAPLRRWCVDLFREWLENPSQRAWVGPAADAAKAMLLSRLPELRGKDLACFCPLGSPCHADVLLELANRDGTVSDSQGLSS